MVRFKNRYLLAEFLDAGSLVPFPDPIAAPAIDEQFHDNDDEALARLPELPFAHLTPPRLPDEGAGLYKAVRQKVQEVFGDEGWGRVASSFRGMFRCLRLLDVVQRHPIASELS